MELHAHNRQISLPEKKLIMLKMLDELDHFCKENQLTYFLVGGTLLGAVRHKGYIPWDDDIDIGLPREDYKKLIRTFSSKSGNVKIIDVDNHDHYRWPSAKAIDIRTELIEQGDTKSVIGVFIDIFPFDGIVGEYETIKKEVTKISTWQHILVLKHLRFDSRRSRIKNLLILLGRIFYLFPDRFLIKRINQMEKRSVPFEKCQYICNFNGAWGIREITKSSSFLKTIEAEFEGNSYSIPIGYDDYLRTVYGDYMELPPVEKRKTHHSSDAYWREK